ncbi:MULTISPECIES: hypothetical protein [Pasteurellaceae]|uniref:hypothetical protein n=1 Tax=Pasteurellaceae TaxID=712 RepID=UPI000509473A|nr:hypothetical protein AUSP0078_00013 [uncultured phage]
MRNFFFAQAELLFQMEELIRQLEQGGVEVDESRLADLLSINETLFNRATELHYKTAILVKGVAHA